jgi:Mg-chelatase subunit ChlD
MAGSQSDLEIRSIATETSTEDGQARRAKATYKARVRTTLSQVLGQDYIDIGGVSEVTLERPSYTDIYFVMDVSASMGLAADDAGRSLLACKTREVNGEECTFACHVRQDGQVKSNLEIAQENGIRTRIDVVRSVAGALLDDVKAAQGKNVFGPDVYRVGLYSFSGWGVNLGGATTLAAPSANIELVRPSIGDARLDNATAYKPMLRDMTQIVGVSQDGSRTDKRRKVVILLTDGHDYGHNWDESKTIDPRDCEPMKTNGVKLYVFNTRWVADWGNWAFDPILGYKNNPLGGSTVFQARV